MVPRRIARYLEDWGYNPASPAFGVNYLSSRIDKTRAEDADFFAIASLCAVPHTALDDIYTDFNDFMNWLQPQSLVHYDPAGLWLPHQSRTFSSAGVILSEQDHSTDVRPARWNSYLLASRDGYFEFGRKAARRYATHLGFPFAPMIAWVERFVALVQDAKARQSVNTRYSLVLNLPKLEGAALLSLDAGWAEPFRWPDEPFPTPIEKSVQLHFILGDDSPKQIARRWAERIDNIFGIHEILPCYNHPNSDGKLGMQGELPTNKLDYN